LCPRKRRSDRFIARKPILNVRCRNCQNPPLRGSNFAAPFASNTGVGRANRSKKMHGITRVSLAATVSVLALGVAGLHGAKAADMTAPQYEAPPPAAYAPPPAPVYGYPPPPPVAYYGYAAPPYVVWPGYYGYWHYGPRFAYGYGRWGYGRGGYGHWGHWHR
jgi:hypothetical protein